MEAVPAPRRIRHAPTPNRMPGGVTTPSMRPSTTAKRGTVRLARETTRGEIYLVACFGGGRGGEGG